MRFELRSSRSVRATTTLPAPRRAGLAALGVALSLLHGAPALLAQEAPRREPEAAPPGPRLTRPPELVTFVEAEYPESERAAARAVTVGVNLTISVDGSVSDAVVVESAGDAFDAAVLAAVRRFVFLPAEVDGAPSAIRILYRYELRLESQVVAQPSALRGRVRARAGRAPLAGIRVAITLADGTIREATTDTEGRFAFDDLVAGELSVAIEGERVTRVLTSESLAAGESLEVTYDVTVLDPEDDAGSEDDLEIVVQAPPLRRAVVSTEVRAEEARLVPGTSGDVVRVVESLPGVARAAAGTGALIVWGAAPDETRIYVDGVPIPRLMHEGGLRSVVQPDAVRSIELVPGGYGAAFGRGLGGIVSVRTETPGGDGLHGTVALDVLDVSALVRGAVNDDVRLAASARVSLLDLYAEQALGAEALAYLPIPRYRDGQARARFTLAPGESLEVVGMLASDRFTRGVPNADPALAVEERRYLDFQRVYARYTRERGDGSVVSITPYVGLDQRETATRNGAVLTSVAGETLLVGLRASYRAHVADWLSVDTGLDAEISATSLLRRGSIGFPAREGDVRVFGQSPPDQIAADRWTAIQIGVAPYLEADLALFSDTLHVVPGLRLDPYARSVSRRLPLEGDAPDLGLFRQDFRAEPRLALRWEPERALSLRAAAGLYHQPPRAEDLSAAFGTPDLPLSQAIHAVLGAAVRPTETLSLELTGFYTQGDDLAMRSASQAPLRAQALVPSGEGRSFGAQALVRQELFEGLSGWIAYTLSRSERLDRPRASDGSGGLWRLSDYDQTHVLTAVVAYRIPGLELDVSLRFRYATGFPRTSVWGASYDAGADRFTPRFGAHNGIRVPDFVQLDARLGRRFEIGPLRLDVSLEVLNVWNQDNAEEIVYAPDYSRRGFVSSLPILPVLGLRGEL
jgi:TonB family protein